MLALRSILFTILLPGTITIYVPSLLLRGGTPAHGPLRFLGLLPIVSGALAYFACVLEFLLRGGGTPALFITRPLRLLLGEEPKILIESALYKYTRNPMYLSVVAVVLGEAWLFESVALLSYALLLWLCFQVVVVFLEEPHLRRRPGYREYCACVPRWLLPSVRK